MKGVHGSLGVGRFKWWGASSIASHWSKDSDSTPCFATVMWWHPLLTGIHSGMCPCTPAGTPSPARGRAVPSRGCVPLLRVPGAEQDGIATAWLWHHQLWWAIRPWVHRQAVHLQQQRKNTDRVKNSKRFTVLPATKFEYGKSSDRAERQLNKFSWKQNIQVQ